MTPRNERDNRRTGGQDAWTRSVSSASSREEESSGQKRISPRRQRNNLLLTTFFSASCQTMYQQTFLLRGKKSRFVGLLRASPLPAFSAPLSPSPSRQFPSSTQTEMIDEKKRSESFDGSTDTNRKEKRGKEREGRRRQHRSLSLSLSRLPCVSLLGPMDW